jgi:Tol biopolymer transport system component
MVADAHGRAWRVILRERPTECIDAEWSPDAKALLFTIGCDADEKAIGLVNADGSGRRILTGRWSTNPVWSPDGKSILFTQSGETNDQWRLFIMDKRGRSRRRVQGRHPEPDPLPNAGPAWSRDGKKIFYLTDSDELIVINRDGSRPRNVTPTVAQVRDFDLSPDGTKLAVTAPGSPDRGWEIYVVNVDGSRLRQLTHNRTHDDSPAWSTDSRKIAFSHGRAGFDRGSIDVYVMNADGRMQRNLSHHPAFDSIVGWLPAGAPL